MSRGEKPSNLPSSITPTVIWAKVDPADVLAGIATLQNLHDLSRLFGYRGEDPDTMISWAFAELEQAEAPGSDWKRHTGQAVGHAKRALDALFDAYLDRDRLDQHLRPRAMFSEKLELLKRRFGSVLPWRLIPAVVANPRDEFEHERIAPSVQAAGLAVEAARAIITAMRAHSDPLMGPAFLGFILGSLSTGPWGHHVTFEGFPSTFAWLWTCSDDVCRVGVGTASTRDTAEVRFCAVKDVTREQHLELLTHWDRLRGNGRGGEGEIYMTDRFKAAGLHEVRPPT